MSLNSRKVSLNSPVIINSNYGTITTILHDIENKKISSFYISYAAYLNACDYSVIVSSKKLVTENSGNQDIYVLNKNHYGVSSSRYGNRFDSKILDHNDMVNKIINTRYKCNEQHTDNYDATISVTNNKSNLNNSGIL